MASNNCILLLVISLSSLFLTFPIEGHAPAESPSGSELASPVSYISSSPYGSPGAPSPYPVASDEEVFLGGGGGGDVSSGAPRDLQTQVTKVIEKTVIAVKAKSDEFLKNVITKRLNDPATESFAKSCLEQCQENYDNANDDVTNVLDDLSIRDFYKASVDLDAIATDVDTCNDCLKEMVGDDPEFKKFDEWVTGVTGDCLGELQKINS